MEVRTLDVMSSEIDATLEDMQHEPAVRLGLRLISMLKRKLALRIVAARAEGPFENAEGLWQRASLEQHDRNE